MTTLQTLDWAMAPEEKQISPVVAGLWIALSVFSWTLSEMLMAPRLKVALVPFWLIYTAGAFLLVAWYFRIGRVFETRWTSYAEGLSPVARALTPCHLLVPAALAFQDGPWWAGLGYELAKVAIVLTVVQRLVRSVKELNVWPMWAALLVTISPVVVGVFGLLVILLLSGLGAMSLLVGGLS